MSSVKQVIVIRKDLKMRRGKEIAQGAHASMAWLTRRMAKADVAGVYRAALTPVEEGWAKGPCAKVCVQVGSEEELLALHHAALEAGLESHLITDAGHTEFGGVPTRTCIGIGPAEAERIDRITGHLKLY